MQFREVVRKRRMVRSYRDEPVDAETVDRIVSVGRRNPSAGFAQGQYLVVVTDAGIRRRIADLAEEHRYVEKGMSPWLSTAPVHIVVCTSEADYRARYGEPDKLRADGTEIEWPVPYWYVDAGACMMLVMLAAVDEGLGAGFFGVHRLGGLKELLGIPDHVTPVGIVTIGHAADGQPVGSARRGWRPLAEVVRRERWS